MSDIMKFSPLWVNWRIGELIGKGTYGSVYRAEKTTPESRYFAALKHISLPLEGTDPSDCENLKNRLISKIETCYSLRGHSNLVSYEDYCVIAKDNQPGFDVFIRTELLTSLPMYQQRNIISEKDIIRLGINLCDAVSVLNFKNILPLSIKPSNIFVSGNGTFKLGDFAESSALFNINTENLKGIDRFFLPPELFQGGAPSPASCVYSIGFVMYRLMNNNRAPFLPVNAALSPDQAEAANLKRLQGQPLPVPCGCRNTALINAIMKACSFNPAARWQDTQGLKNALLSVLQEQNAPAYENIKSSVRPIPVQPNRDVKPPVGNAPVQMNQGYRPEPALAPEKKPKKTGLIVLIIVLCVILVAALGVAAYFLIGHFSGNFYETPGESASESVPESENPSEDTLDESSEPTEESTQTETSEPASITVSSYIDLQYEQVKSELESEGIVVVCKKVPSFDIERNVITEQNPPAGTVLSAGDTVELTVSAGVQFDDAPTSCTQILHVKSSGQNAVMTLYNYNANDNYWEKIFTCSATVGVNGVGDGYGEGKKITPKGIFKIGTVLASSQPSTNIPWTPATSSTCIVEDINSDYYNQIMDKNDLPSGTDVDNIGQRLVDGTQNASIFIEHNGDGFSSDGVVKGKCSSITICGSTSSLGATNGCIDITSSDMVNLLRNLDSARTPYIKTE